VGDVAVAGIAGEGKASAGLEAVYRGLGAWGLSSAFVTGLFWALGAGLLLLLGVLGRATGALLTAACLCVLGASLVFSIGQQSTGPPWMLPPRRYLIAPRVLWWLLLVSCWAVTHAPQHRVVRWLAGALLVATLLRGAMVWGTAEVEIRPRPPWRAEVARYREDPEHLLRIVPEPWLVALRGPEDVRALTRAIAIEGALGALETGTPTLGSNVEVRLRDAAPRAVGRLVVQVGRPVLPRATPLSGSFLSVLPGSAVEPLEIAVACDDQGGWATSIPLSSGSSYAGQALTLQVFFTSPAAGVSNGVEVVLGY
jgi:hypothetical protein